MGCGSVKDRRKLSFAIVRHDALLSTCAQLCFCSKLCPSLSRSSQGFICDILSKQLSRRCPGARDIPCRFQVCGSYARLLTLDS
jgi:hypothetical protein